MTTQKPYPVSFVAGPPVYDSLPVAKIIDYPLEERDYRPFAQCILCTGADRLYLRMWAFEVSVMPTSAIGCVLYLYPDHPDIAAGIWLTHGENHQVEARIARMENGGETPLPPDRLAEITAALEIHPHNGEDLQGVYWGQSLSLPISALEQLGGATALETGKSFPGNFYKTCGGPRFAHQGSYFPARFPDRPFAPDSMGEFRVVPY